MEHQAFSIGRGTARESSTGPKGRRRASIAPLRQFGSFLPILVVVVSVFGALSLVSNRATAQESIGTAFTYQGFLKDNGSPANTTYDFEFELFDAATNGSQVGSTVYQDDLAVSDGLFVAKLDFGASVFDGDARWLEIGVRLGSETGAYTTLEPRQELTPAPYALKAPLQNSLAAADASPMNAVFVDADGKAGIGTLNPSSLLTVAGSAEISGPLQIEAMHSGDQVQMILGKMETEVSPNTPISIPDNNPFGVEDSIAVPDVGIAQKLLVSIDITNSAIEGLEVTLTDPDSNSYTLYAGSDTGTRLVASYPDPVPTVSGDLTTWIGDNPQGTWTLKVIDDLYLNNTWDGRISSWSIAVLTEAGDAVHVWNSDLLAHGNVGIGTTDPQSALHVEGYVQLDTLTAAPPAADCDAAAERGRMKVDTVNDLLYICTNSGWVSK